MVKNGCTVVAIGKRNNQNFTQVSHAKFTLMLTYKLEKIGITVKVGEEYYTSKASLIDWDTIPTFDPNNKANAHLLRVRPRN